jgi:DNA-directed RNA polymerase subunit RPC12/RpoP
MKTCIYCESKVEANNFIESENQCYECYSEWIKCNDIVDNVKKETQLPLQDQKINELVVICKNCCSQNFEKTQIDWDSNDFKCLNCDVKNEIQYVARKDLPIMISPNPSVKINKKYGCSKCGSTKPFNIFPETRKMKAHVQCPDCEYEFWGTAEIDKSLALI